MIKKNIQLFYILICLLVFPNILFAAELVFKVSPNNDSVEVRIDPKSKQMNVVEGKIQFSGEASDGLYVQVENGQSILPIWPTPPNYDEKNKSIKFVGGVPNGFDSEGLLFVLRFSPTASGDLTLAYTEGSGYLNDGKGTEESIYSKPLEVYVGEGKINVSSENSSSVSKYKYVTIILLVFFVVIFVVFKYGFNKKYKQ